MKTTIFSLLMVCGVTAFGQFIPQPNAYNPDVNGDSFIGVDDVMGTLALFGNAFDNGDSLQTLTLQFSVLDQSNAGLGYTPNEKFLIPLGVDILIVEGIDVSQVWLELPATTGFRSMLIMATTVNQNHTTFKFYRQGWDGSPVLKTHTTDYKGEWTALIHHPNGMWLTPRSQYASENL